VDTGKDELIVQWFKVETAMASHRKTRLMSREPVTAPARTAAMGVWWFAAAWTAEKETDGFVPAEEFERWDPNGNLTPILADAGYLEDATVGGEVGYMLHDWLDWQKSAEQLHADRVYDSRKAALHRDPLLTATVRERDKDRCRYCGALVNWRDRRSNLGGTYDYVEPAGPNTLDNVVVSCRGCSSIKAGRLLKEAGMPLLEPGATGRPVGSSSFLAPSQNGSGSVPGTTCPIDIEVDIEQKNKNTPPRAAPAEPDPDGFADFWAAWPKSRRVDKRAARRAYTAALKRGVAATYLVEAASRYATLMTRMKTEPRFIKHPATWLNAGSYDDEFTMPKVSSGRLEY
jgi:hypothetical protein